MKFSQNKLFLIRAYKNYDKTKTYIASELFNISLRTQLPSRLENLAKISLYRARKNEPETYF